ncbi:MAG: methyl-accepting chemotaxis protein [Desulfovibrio fairfieldensis]|nr:methyl-accepting chemotaxis protein [Desulfovibrio fairfieldensis]
MENLKIWQKMTMGIGLILLLAVVISVVSLNVMKTVDEETTNIKIAFAPLQQLANHRDQQVTAIPGQMLAYQNGNAEAWDNVRRLLEQTDQSLTGLAAHLKANPVIPDTGKAAAGRAAFENLKKSLLETHTAQESLVALRNDMNKTGAKLLDETRDYVQRMNTVLDRFVADQDTAEAARALPLVQVGQHVMDAINYLRIRMLRSLAENNRDYAKDNLPVLFPALLTQVDELLPRIRNAELQEHLKTLRAHVEEYRDAQAKTLRIWERIDALNAQCNQACEEAIHAARGIAEAGDKLQTTAIVTTDNEVSSAITLIYTVSSAALLAGLLIGLVLTRGITVPVGRALRFARAVAEGRLDQRLGLRRKDEIGQLSVALDSMVDALNEKISEAERQSHEAEEQSRNAQAAMRQAEAAGKNAQAKTEAMLAAADKLEAMGNVLSSASTQLSAQIEQADKGAAESAQRLSEAAAAINEMDATVQDVARNAGAAESASGETREKAEAGAGIVEKAVQSIEEVHRMSITIKDDMAQLSEHAQAITQIMNVISDIADQTNLLALNAAIEAARAGEAGRGFAVVADEVRKLAEKTMASTNDVSSAIKAIQESTAKSMEAVDGAVNQIGQATGLANDSGRALQEIVATVESTADQVHAIAAASEEQSATSQEINQSIVLVNDRARETAVVMTEAAKAVEELASQAQGLTRLIQELKNS